MHLNILVYVDDFIIARNSSSGVTALKKYLGCCFHMKDLEALNYFLGIEVSRGSDGIYLCQRKYDLDITAEIRLLGGKPVSVPIEQNHHLAVSSAPLMSNPESY